MARYSSPVPGGRVGRTDQGVDVSASPGTPIRAIADSEFVGRIANWFKGQPFEWFRVKGTNLYWYAAEQIAPIQFWPGQEIRQGDPIGRVAQSGTGLEFGWATSRGQTLARSTTGYREGQVTPAGKDFRARVFGRQTVSGGSRQWKSCLLTWYDPALGGTNSSSGRRDPHSATASGEPYNPNAYTCAAPPSYAFGTRIMFRFQGRSVTCRVNDRGGAIQGAHFDLSRRAAHTLGIGGMAHAQFAVVSGAAGSGGGITRPGGDASGGAANDAALESFFGMGYTDDATGTGPKMVRTAGGGTMRPVVFGIPGTPSIPSPLDLIPDIPNPLDLFKSGEQAITDAASFLKFIVWLFHPRNILRVVETLIGLGTIGISLYLFTVAYRGQESQSRGRRRQNRVIRRDVGRAKQATKMIATVVPK